MKNRIYTYTMLLAMLFFNKCAISQQIDEINLYQECVRLNESYKYDSVINILSQNSITNNNKIYFIKEKATAFFMLKRYDSTQVCLDSILAISQNNIFANYCKAILCFDNKNYENALNYLNKCIESKGGELGYIDCYLPKNQLVECDFDINFVKIIFLRAEIYYSMGGNYNNAINDFLFCISKEYDLGNSYYYLSNIFYLDRNYKLSCQYFKEALNNGYEDEFNEYTNFCNPTVRDVPK